MGSLIVRFERLVLTSDAVATAEDAGPAPPRLVPTEVRFRSGPYTLAGYLYAPEGADPVPAVVLNHGSTIHQGTTDVCRPGTAALFLRWGYAVLLVHRHGYGNSEGPTWREDVSAEFGTPEYDRALATRLEREADDVLAARAFLATRPGIAPARLGVIGSSFGGTVSLLAAARDASFGCAVDFAGAAMNWERTPALRAAMLDAARRITVPILLAQAANDYSVGPTRELGAELTRLGKRHEALTFPPFGITRDEGHGFFQNGSLEWGPTVRAVLDRWLTGG
jgi:dienelactone hydrolase